MRFNEGLIIQIYAWFVFDPVTHITSRQCSIYDKSGNYLLRLHVYAFTAILIPLVYMGIVFILLFIHLYMYVCVMEFVTKLDSTTQKKK